MSPEILSAWAAVSVALLGVLLTGCAVWFGYPARPESRMALRGAADRLRRSRNTNATCRLLSSLRSRAYGAFGLMCVGRLHHTGFLIELVVVGNSGPTVATDVQISFDPPLPVSRQNGERACLHRHGPHPIGRRLEFLGSWPGAAMDTRNRTGHPLERSVAAVSGQRQWQRPLRSTSSPKLRP